jgi:hypothetical protein
MALDPDFFPDLRAVAASLQANPADVMLVLYGESGLDPASHRAGSDYYGINQMNGGYLRRAGIDPADYLTWPASRQLDAVVAPFLKGLVASQLKKPVRSAGVLEALNLYPAAVGKHGDAPDAIVIDGNSNDAAERAAYRANQALDQDHSGAITISDLDTWLLTRSKDKPYQQALAQLGGAPTPSPPTQKSSITGAFGKAFAIIGAASFFAWALRKRRV